MGRKVLFSKGMAESEAAKILGAKEQNGTTLEDSCPQTQVHKEVLKPNRREGNQKTP